MKVAVLMGGLSKEREISLRSGAAVAAALARKGYEVHSIDAGADLAGELKKIRPEAVFIALHGRFGEDGSVQGVLEIMGIPYTGSGVAASAIGIDKILTKRVVAAAGVRVAPDRIFRAGDPIAPFCDGWPYEWPAIIKPAREGSSLGLSLVDSPDEMGRGLKEAVHFDSDIVVEPFIKGRELTVGLLDGVPLPTLEVIPAGGLYDYKAKYTKGMTAYKVPADIPASVDQRLKEQSRQVWQALGLSGFARADYIIGEADSEPVFLEINTIPGFTELSLVPKAAAAAGIGFDELVDRIMKTASLKISRGLFK